LEALGGGDASGNGKTYTASAQVEIANSKGVIRWRGGRTLCDWQKKTACLHGGFVERK